DESAQGMLLCYFLVFDVDQNILHAQQGAAREFLLDYKNEHGASYIFVLDGDNHIMAQTFEGDVPDAVQGLLEAQKGKAGLQKQEILLDGKPTLDISVPFVGAPGHVHLGLDLTRSRQQLRQLVRDALVTVLAVLAAGIAFLWVVMSRMVTPIHALADVARKIVVEGDLTHKIKIESRDEIGQLATYFNEMVDWQKSIYEDLSTTVLVLNETVKDMESLSEAQNQAVTIQATALQETQVTAQEIKQTSQMAARKAEDILGMAEKAEKIGRAGEESVEQSLAGLTDIRHQVQEIAQKIADLTERTRQIGSITDTVKDLADQSNMLALNAAIEAVRSGEHGKGFGLVAREIRRLADQSIQSTGRVKEILDNITEAIEQVFQITESGSKRMEGGYAQVKDSGENLKALASVVRENSASVRQIATAVEQQNVGITQIFGAVTDQTKMMTEAVKHVETTGEMVKVLKGASQRLSDVLKKYKA
ncbi:MAG TPA: methyl-accepting chemotaxis protein, partial [bacterium]|nr:methyl-accepting chemotaxis protein [bacterium]